MRISETEEMRKLREKVEPYIIDCIGPVYKEDTPQEIKDAHKKLHELSVKQTIDASF